VFVWGGLGELGPFFAGDVLGFEVVLFLRALFFLSVLGVSAEHWGWWFFFCAVGWRVVVGGVLWGLVLRG